MATGPTQRRPIKHTESKEYDYDTETPPSPTTAAAAKAATVKTSQMGKIGRKSKPLNVYKAGSERKGASLKIILFLLATTCYTAFLYSGAVTDRLTDSNQPLTYIMDKQLL